MIEFSERTLRAFIYRPGTAYVKPMIDEQGVASKVGGERNGSTIFDKVFGISVQTRHTQYNVGVTRASAIASFSCSTAHSICSPVITAGGAISR